MEWNQLKEKAKEIGYCIIEPSTKFERIENDVITFWPDGDIDVDGVCISSDRSPSQMYSIMKALQ